MDAELPRLIACRGNNTALPGSADRDGLAAKVRIIALFDRRVEGIHIDMDDLSDRRRRLTGFCALFRRFHSGPEPVSISTCRASGRRHRPGPAWLQTLRRRRGNHRPRPAFEQRQQRRRYEARSRRIDMAVAIGRLAVGIEALRRH